MTEPTLKRRLSLALITCYGLGSIVGAGIYVLVAEVAGYAGLYAPVSFLVAALLATFTAFSYGELSARYPKSAGEAIYVREGLRSRPLSVAVGAMMVLTGVVSAATMVKGFIGYLHVFFAFPDAGVILLTVACLAALALWGIAESVIAASLITLVEIGGLLLIVWVAGDSLQTLPARLPELVPPLDAGVWKRIMLGAFLAFYAFIGFEDMVNVAEEVRDPSRNLPRAILLALATVAVLYTLVALVAVLAMPLSELAGSKAPLATIYERASGRSPTLIALIGLFAILNGALIQMIMGSRVLYGMSRERWLPDWLGRVHPRTRTPHLATLVVALLVLGFALWVPLVRLAEFTSFVILAVFTLINLALIRIKRLYPAPPGVWAWPLWVPWVGFASSGGFLLFQLSRLVR